MIPIRPSLLIQYGAVLALLIAPLVAYFITYTGRYMGWHLAIVVAYYVMLLLIGALVHGSTRIRG